MDERQSNLASLGSDSAVEVTTFEKGAGAHVDENAQSFYSKKSPSGKYFLFAANPRESLRKQRRSGIKLAKLALHGCLRGEWHVRVCDATGCLRQKEEWLSRPGKAQT